jgi:uncharacterized protein (TIGR02145 family)
VLEEFEELRGDKIKFQVRADVGNIETVVIGNQEWTVKNLDVSRYRNGDIIPEVKDPAKWANLKTGAWCYYNNDPKKGKIYGKLYNWYAVNDPRGLAPEGFHIPSDDELMKILYLTEEVKFKDSNGFRGLPGGARRENNKFKGIVLYGIWWASTKNVVTKKAWYVVLFFDDDGFGSALTNDVEINGFSVRCVRD